MSKIDLAKKILNTKEGKAIMDMIAYAEGTSGAGDHNGYDVTIGYYKIAGWTVNYQLGHQNTKWYNKSANSTAAGRYQFVFATWKGLSKTILNETNSQFNQKNQDIFGAYLVYSSLYGNFGNSDTRKIGDGKYILEKPKDLKLINKNNFTVYLDTMATTWSSLPFSPKGGKGYHSNQGGKLTANDLYKIYTEALNKY
jgi:muramidase (phage lysozyme)